ncbi:hypothetical protein JXA80_01735 [bacterium]|nr:hypothetical protein [candidate division CSSED10-310 bacterium]
MKRMQWLVWVVTVCSTGAVVYAADALPHWEPGYTWWIGTHMDIHAEDPATGDQVDMIIDDNAPPYVCIGIETRTLSRGAKLTYDVYRLIFEGTVTGSGTADIDLMDVEIPIELRNGTIRGETWVDCDTLGTVLTSRFITAELYANILFTWQKVGDAEIVLTEEYEPARDVVHFPVEVGNTWTDAMSMFVYGRYSVNYDIGSGPQHEENTFDSGETGTMTFRVTGREPFKTWDCYTITGDSPDWSGAYLARYSPLVRNTVLLTLTGFSLPEQGILLRDLTQEVMDYRQEAFPTATPTPTPNPAETGVTLHLNQEEFRKWDTFHLSRTVVNSGSGLTVDEYILLEVYGQFWFWPSWNTTGDYLRRTLGADTIYAAETVMSFMWPEVEGSAAGLRFWAAMLDRDRQTLYGGFDKVDWGYR